MINKMYLGIASLVVITGVGLGLCVFEVPQFKHIKFDLDATAQARSVVNDVKRRAADSLSWAPLKAGQDLYLSDSVITAAQSSVEIVFTTGELLNLGPDTLVSIQAAPKEELPYVLSLLKGQYQLRSNVERSLQLNELTVRFLKPSLIIVKKLTEQISFELMDGQAEIIDRITGSLVQSLSVGSPLLITDSHRKSEQQNAMESNLQEDRDPAQE